MVSRWRFNKIKKENPESRIWKRTREEQEVRNDLAKTLIKSRKKWVTHPYVVAYKNQLKLQDTVEDKWKTIKELKWKLVDKTSDLKTKDKRISILESENLLYEEKLKDLWVKDNEILTNFDSFKKMWKIDGKELIVAEKNWQYFLLSDWKIVSPITPSRKIDFIGKIQNHIIMFADNDCYIDSVYVWKCENREDFVKSKGPFLRKRWIPVIPVIDFSKNKMIYCDNKYLREVVSYSDYVERSSWKIWCIVFWWEWYYAIIEWVWVFWPFGDVLFYRDSSWNVMLDSSWKPILKKSGYGSNEERFHTLEEMGVEILPINEDSLKKCS